MESHVGQPSFKGRERAHALLSREFNSSSDLPSAAYNGNQGLRFHHGQDGVEARTINNLECL